MTDFDIHTAWRSKARRCGATSSRDLDAMSAEGLMPFRILIATSLSLRSKDTLTAMLALVEERIAELLYPVGLYRWDTSQPFTAHSNFCHHVGLTCAYHRSRVQ
jgi:endonuclease-3